MDINGDGHHDWQDDALLDDIMKNEQNKKPDPGRYPAGPGCGTVFLVVLGVFCVVSMVVSLLR